MTLLRYITEPNRACLFFITALMIVYAAIPMAVHVSLTPNEYFVQLSALTSVAVLSIVVGSLLPFFDSRFRPDATRIQIPANIFHAAVWTTFIIFAIFTIATAPSIPILSAISGASVEDLDRQRGDFLKSRTGMEAILIYLSTLFTSALLPYSLAQLYITKNSIRHILALLFLTFAVLFLVKALFITVAAPVIYVLARRNASANSGGLVFVILGACFLLYLITKLALGSGHAVEVPETEFNDFSYYFTSQYQAIGIIDFLGWRILSVPMFTAADTLVVFDVEFSSQFILGATSSLIAGLFGLTPVPLEKIVYAHQFGWNDLANSNSVYIADSYVNFGWGGLVLTSLVIGQALRWFRLSCDDAFRAQWLLFCYMLFTGGIFGVLLSNGYAIVLFAMLFLSINQSDRLGSGKQ